MEPAATATRDDERRLVELMISWQAADLAAFEELYARLADELQRFFERQQRTAAHDLVQEVFLEMHRARRTYRPPLPVRPWVYGIARNVLARERRSRAQGARAQSTFGQEVSTFASGVGSTVDSLDVERALIALPHSTREPWLLHHILGLDFQAIAQRLGITVMAARLRSSRASRALRNALRADDGEKR